MTINLETIAVEFTAPGADVVSTILDSMGNKIVRVKTESEKLNETLVQSDIRLAALAVAQQKYQDKLDAQVRSLTMSKDALMMYDAALLGNDATIIETIDKIGMLKLARDADALAAKKNAEDIAAMSAYHKQIMKEEQAARAAQLREEVAYYTAQEKLRLKSIADAEKQALEEIKWTQTSIKTRIAELERLKLAQAAGVSSSTISNNFSAGALKDLSAYEQRLGQYTEKLVASTLAAKASGDAHSHAAIGMGSALAKVEALRIGHDAIIGSYGRMASSTFVLANATGVSTAMFSAAGAGIALLLAPLALLAYAFVKGAAEQKEMNIALQMTGNYAGQTINSMHGLAESISNSNLSIGVAKQAVTELAASGRFTSDQIGIVAKAVTELQQATGQSVEKTIKAFESLAVEAGEHMNKMSDRISTNLLKLNDTQHFLTLEIYNQIVAMEKNGDQMGASALAMQTLASATDARTKEIVKSLNLIEKSWLGIKMIAADALNTIERSISAAQPGDKIISLTKERFDLMTKIANLEKMPFGLGDSSAVLLKQQLIDVTIKLSHENFEWQKSIDAARAASEKAQKDEAGLASQREIDRKTMQLEKKDIEGLTEARTKYAAAFALAIAADPKSGQDGGKNSLAAQEHFFQLLDESYKKHKATSRVDMQGEVADIKANFDEKNASYNDFIRAQNKYYDAKQHLAQDDLKVSIANDKASSALQIVSAQAYTVYLDKLKQQNQDRVNVEIAANIKMVAEKAAETDALMQVYNKQISATTDEEGKIRNLQQKALNDFKKYAQEKSDARDAIFAKQSNDDSKNEADAVVKVTENIDKQIEAVQKEIEKEKERGLEIGKTKAQIDELRAAHELKTAKAIQGLADETLAEIFARKGRGEDTSALEASYNSIMKLIAAKKEFADVKLTNAPLDEEAAKWTAMMKNANDFASQMEKSFGSVGKAIGGMTKAFTEYSDKQKKGTVELKDQVQLYGDLAGSAAGFFKEGSKGYETLMNMEKIYRGIQLALQAQALASSIASSTASGTAAAGPFILKAGAQTGWWGAIAAMGLVAALGYAGAGGFDKTSGDGTSAAEVQKAQGTGGVFGDDLAKSATISKSIELLSKNSDIMLPLTQGMLTALNSIDAAMKGVTNIIVRTTGLANGTNMGITTGVMSKNSGDPILNMVGLGFINDTMTNLPVIGGIIKTLQTLWGKTTVDIIDSGITLTGMLSQLQQGKGVNQYANVATTTSSWFGLVKSTSNSSVNGDVSDELKQQFGQIFKNIETALVDAAKILGFDGDKTSQAIESYVVDLTKISLKDLKGKDLEDALNAAISKVTDDVALSAIKGFDEFRQVGEGYAETIIRVASGVDFARHALSMLGVTMVDYTKILNKQGDVALEIIRDSVLANEHTGTFHEVTAAKAAYTTQETTTSQVWVGPTPEQSAQEEINAANGLGRSADMLTGHWETLTQTIDVVHPAVAAVTSDLNGVGQILQNFSGTPEDFLKLRQELEDLRTSLRNVGADVINLDLDMITGAKGIGALQAGLNTYYDKAFTAQEKQGNLVQQNMTVFNGLNQVMPTTWAGFRALADSMALDVTPAGKAAYGALMAAAPTFGLMVDGADAMAAAFQQSSENIQNSINQLNGVAASNTALSKLGLVNKDWGSIENLKTLTPDDIQKIMLNDDKNKTHNIDLIQQALAYAVNEKNAANSASSSAANPSTAVATTAVTSAADLLNQKLALQAQIYALTGDKVAAANVLEQQHQIILDGLDPSLRDFQTQLWGLQDAETAAAAALKQINDVLALQSQIYALNGDKVGAATVLQLQHNLALAELHKQDPTGQLEALTLQLWSLQAAAQAATEATTAANLAQQQAENTKTGALNNVDKAFATLQRSVDAARKATNLAFEAASATASTAIDNISTSVSKLDSLSKALASSLSGMNVLPGQEGISRVLAQRQIASALSTAQTTGVLPQTEDLTDALSVVSKPSEGLFKTFLDYQKDFIKTKNDIESMQKLATGGLTTEQQNLANAKAQLQALKDQNDADNVYYDKVLEDAQTQIDILKGIDISILSVVEAIANLAKMMTSSALPTPQTFGAHTDLNKWLATATGYTGDFGSNGFMEFLSTHPEFDLNSLLAAAPHFAVGTNFVQRDMLAQIHKGEEITPRAFVDQQSVERAKTNQLLEKLLNENTAMKQDIKAMRASAANTETATVKSTQILKNITPNGDSMTTSV